MGCRDPAPPPLPVTVLRGHSSGVQALCFLNEEVLLSGSQDGVVKAWSLERRRVCAEFDAHSHGAGVQRLDRLGTDRVVSQGRDGLVKIWDAERLAGCGAHTAPPPTAQSPEPLLTRTTGAFHFCQFALTRWREEGARGGQGRSAREGRQEEGNGWQGTGNNSSDPERGPTQARGSGGEFEGKHGAPGGDDGESSVPEGVSSGSFTENMMLAPCHDKSAICLWDLRDSASAFTIAPADADGKGMVMCVRLLGESSLCTSPFALCGHDSGHLCVYDLRATTAEPLMEARLHKEPLLSVDVGSSCKQGVSGSADGNINIFSINTRKGLCEVIKTFRSEHPGTSCIEIRRDQKLFVTGGWDHRVRIFSWKRPRPLAVLRSHEESVYTVAHSPRLGGLASGSKDSRIALWDVFSEGRRKRQDPTPDTL